MVACSVWLVAYKKDFCLQATCHFAIYLKNIGVKCRRVAKLTWYVTHIVFDRLIRKIQGGFTWLKFRLIVTNFCNS
jgi:hypothetical protein